MTSHRAKPRSPSIELAVSPAPAYRGGIISGAERTTTGETRGQGA
jgi:3-deoxy-D-arabino-heptulosonate 7-phosphate (DAHP) synthase class II